MADATNASALPVYDVSGDQPALGTLPHEEVHDAIASGQYSLPKGTTVKAFDPDGNLGELPAEEAHAAFNGGYRYATPDAIDDYKNSSTSEQIKAGLEGVGQGLVGPLATIAERAADVNPKDMLRRSKTAAHAVGDVAGLVGGTLTGTGEAALMEGAGRLASEASGLSEAASVVGQFGPRKPSLLSKVGSEMVKQAAEMAVLSSGDEASKALMNDPDASSTNAIANVGLSSALGAGTGALFAGAVSPLWKATVGDKAGEFLTGLTKHLNGEGRLTLPENLQKSFTDLGIEPHPMIQAALSGDPKALEYAQELYRAQNPAFMEALNSVPNQVKQAVSQGLGIPLEDAAVFSAEKAGDEVGALAKAHIDEKYGPIQERLNKRDAQAAIIDVPDEDRLNFGSQIMERAASSPSIGTDSPYYKEYEHYSQRVLAKDTVGGLDALSTEIRNKAVGTQDLNLKHALFEIRNMIGDFKEGQILRQAEKFGLDTVDHSIIERAEQAHMQANAAKEVVGLGSGAVRAKEDLTQAAKQATNEAKAAVQAGRQEGREMGQAVVKERALTNSQYREYAQMLDQLTDHLGVGKFRGTETLKQKLDSLSSEDIIKKFATKGDSASQEFLRTHFPELADKVREYEAKVFLSPSIHDRLGETEVDVKNLSKRLENLMKGNPEHAAYILPPGGVERIKAAKSIHDALSTVKGIKDSGTPAGIGKIFAHFGAGAAGLVGFLAGHNPISTAVLGEAAQRLGKDIPEAYKLGMLKFLGSNKEVNAPALKATVKFISQSIKGEHMATQAVAAVFKRGGQVLGEKGISSLTQRDKLDKIVDEYQENPTKFAQNLQNGDVGHYAPEHQTALTQQSTQAVQYLANLKPKPTRSGAFDRPIEPSKEQMQRYNRALDIAQQPLSVLEHVKNGTLQPSDMTDLNAMYPGYYQHLAKKVTQEMTNAHMDASQVPYKTRMGVSLFLGQPLDQSMSPNNIVAAQMANQVSSQQAPQAPQGGSKRPSQKAGTMLAKGAKSYQTASQSAESDRGGRD